MDEGDQASRHQGRIASVQTAFLMEVTAAKTPMLRVPDAPRVSTYHAENRYVIARIQTDEGSLTLRRHDARATRSCLSAHACRAESRAAAEFMKTGDAVETQVEGLGPLRNPIG